MLGILQEDLTSGRPRLIRLRNPWGRGEWAGAWSKKWLRRNRKESGLLQTRPGEFFMPLEDFKANYYLLSLCTILTGSWQERQGRAEFSPHRRTVEFRLELGETSDTRLAFSQLGRRELRDEMGSQQTLLDIRLSVWRLEDNTRALVGAEQRFRPERTRTAQSVLEAGLYRVRGQAWRVEQNTPVLLRVAATSKYLQLSRHSL